MSPRPQTCWRIFKENKKQNKWIKELANLACELLNERSEHRIRPTVPTPEEKKEGAESHSILPVFSHIKVRQYNMQQAGFKRRLESYELC